MELKKITLQLVTELLNDAHGKTMIVPSWDKKKYFERENQLLDFDDISYFFPFFQLQHVRFGIVHSNLDYLNINTDTKV